MSQKSEQDNKRIIKRGNDDIDLDLFIRNLEHNYTRWADSKGFNNKQRQAIDDAYRDMITEYNEGRLTPKVGGMSTHSLGRIKNEEKGFDAYGIVQGYFNDVLNRQSTYTKESTKSTKVDYDPSKGIATQFNPYLFAGRTTFNPDFILQDVYNPEIGKREITNRTQPFLQALNSYRKNLDNIFNFKDDSVRNQHLLSLNALQNALSDGQLTENERVHLSNLGLNPDDYFFTGEKYGTTAGETNNQTDNEHRLEEAQKAAQDVQVGKMADLYTRWTDYMSAPERNLSVQFNNYTPTTNFKGLDEENSAILDAWEKRLAGQLEQYLSKTNIYKLAENPEFLNTVDPSFLRKLGITNNLKYKKSGTEVNVIDDNWTNGQKLAYLFDIYVKHHAALNNGSTPTFGNNQHIMNYSGKYARIYDPSTRRMYDKRVADIPELMEIEFAEFNPKVQSEKNGGILKAQQGLNLSNVKSTDQIREEFAEKRKQQKEKEEINKANEEGKSIEQYKAGQEKIFDEGFSTYDYLRAGAIAADLTSIVASFVPTVGTAASGVAGLTGAGLDLAADVMDKSVSAKQVGTNLLTNLGLSAFALVPVVGSSGKIAKIAKWIPRGIGMVSAAGITLDDSVHKSLNKLVKGEFNSITRDDWKNISHFAQALSGISQIRRHGYNAAKYRGLNTKTSSGEFTIKSKEGRLYNLKEADIKKINEAGKKDGNDKANEIFQSLTRSRDTLNADFKTSGVLKGVRSKEVKGTPTEGSFNDNINRIRSLLERQNNIYKTTHPTLSKYINTDYDIYFNNKQLIPGLKTPRFKSILDKYTTKTSTQHPITTQQPLSQLSFKHLSKNTPIHDLRKYVENGRLNQKAIRILDAKLPNWKNRQFNTNGLANFLRSKGVRNTNNINNFVYDNNRIVFWKNGGSIRKYDIGGAVDWYWKNQHGNLNVGDGQGFFNLKGWDNNLRRDLAGQWIQNNGHYKADNLVEAFNRNQAYTSNKDLISKDLNSYYNNKYSGLSAEDFVKQYNSDSSKIREFFSNPLSYNTKGANVLAHNQLFKQMFENRSLNTEGLDYNIGYQDNIDDVLGSSTWLRRMDTYENEFNVNNPDQNRIHTITGKNGQTFQVYKKANGDIEIYTPSVVNNPLENQEVVSQETSDVGARSFQKKDSTGLTENLLKYKGDIIGAGRLIGTLSTNKSIYDTMRSSIKPLITNTYELYSPITGAFSEMQLRNRQSSQMLSSAYRPFTSDANLASARMLEGQKQANELQYQGFLADDKEIKRTQEAALARQEDNAKRRTEIANTNKASILQNNQRLAQLKSDYKLKNWNAINTFLSGKESDARENWERYKNYAIDSETKRLQLEMQNEMRLYEDNWKQYLAANPNETDITKWPLYNEYMTKSKDYQIKLYNTQNKISSRLYGWPYSKFNLYNYEALS